MLEEAQSTVEAATLLGGRALVVLTSSWLHISNRIELPTLQVGKDSTDTGPKHLAQYRLSEVNLFYLMEYFKSQFAECARS